MYSKEIEERLATIVRNWTGKIGKLEDLNTHDLIIALDEERCNVMNDSVLNKSNYNPLVPIILQQELSKRILNLAENINDYSLPYGKIKQVYQLVRPKNCSQLNRLFVYTTHQALGIGYNPEKRNWDQGEYNLSQKEAEHYIYTKYGGAVKLLEENNNETEE